MKNRIKSIEAFENPGAMGMGSFILEPIPTFHPPSLPKQPEQKATKLMQRLLKQKELETEQFRMTLLQKQTKTVMPMVYQVPIDPTPIFMPPLYFSSVQKYKRRIKK